MNPLKILVNNLGLKIFSLVAALVIYFYASLERSYSTIVSIPLAFRSLDSSLVIARVETTFARVGVEAKGKDLLRLRFAKPLLQLDLSHVQTGMNRFLLKNGELKMPSGIAVRAIKPDTIELPIDLLGKKRMTVTVPIKGKPQKGFALNRIVIKDTVYLFGPRDEVMLFTGLNTEPCALQNLSQATDKRLKVLLPPDKNFESRPESVLVRIEIEPEAKKTFSNLKLGINRAPGIQATVTPMQVTIEVAGPTSRINQLTADEIQTTLRLKDLKHGSYELPCEIVLPEGISLSKSDPARFQVEVH
jgi:YbbR domain-containing protein